MKFGIFYELQLPRPWAPDGERKLYQDALTQVEHALHLLDFAMADSTFKRRIVRELALWLAEARYRERRQAAGLPPARRFLRSYLVK